MEEKEVCPKCHGSGRIVDRDGTVHCCWDCLASGKMDEHDKTFRDHGIRL